MAAASDGARGGIDLGGTKIEALVVDPGNDVLGAMLKVRDAHGWRE